MNRFTKHIVGAAACLALGATLVAAQEATAPATGKTGEPQHMRHMRGKKMARMHGMQMGYMARDLNLTDAQKQQMKSFHEQQRTKAEAIRNNESLTKEQKQEQFKTLRQSGHEQMLSVLTPEQKTKIEQHKADRKAKMEKRKAERKEFREWKKQKESTTQKPQ